MLKHRCSYCKKQFTSRSSLRKYCSLTCSNRANRNNSKSVSLPKSKSAELAELFGILLGDGSVAQYYSRIYLNRIADAEYWPYVRDLCIRLFPGATVSAIDRPKRGTREIQISSKSVSTYLVKCGFDPKIRSVPNWISSNKGKSKRCIRGLVDTEGTVGIKRYTGVQREHIYAQLTFTNKNKNLLSFIESKLMQFGYSPTRNSRKNIYISNARDIQRYMLEIGSSNPKFAKKLALRGATRRGARAV